MPHPATPRRSRSRSRGPWMRYRIKGKSYATRTQIPEHDLIRIERGDVDPRALTQWGLTLVGTGDATHGAGSEAVLCGHPQHLRKTGPGASCARCHSLLPGGTGAYICSTPGGKLCQSWLCTACASRPTPHRPHHRHRHHSPAGHRTAPLASLTPTLLHPLEAKPAGYLEQTPEELAAEIATSERLHGETSAEAAHATAKLGWTQVTATSSTSSSAPAGQDGVANLSAALEILRSIPGGGATPNAATCGSQMGWGMLRLACGVDAAPAPSPAAASRRLRGALHELEAALSLAVEAEGPASHAAAVCRSRVAIALGVSGDHARGVCEMHRAVSDLQALWGDLHPDTATARSQLGWLLAEAGRSNEAGAELARALDGLLESTGEGSVPSSICRMRLAAVFRGLGDTGSARVLLEGARDALRVALGPSSSLVQSCQADLDVVRNIRRVGGGGSGGDGDLSQFRKALCAEGLTEAAVSALVEAGCRSVRDVAVVSRDSVPGVLGLEDRQRLANLCSRLSVGQWLAEATAGEAAT